jgi:paraquat-inducible protein B
MAEDLQEPLPEPAVDRSGWRRLSILWLVPLVALAVGATLLGRHLLRTGPEIQIELRTAEGLESGRTVVRFREVVVGRVTQIVLTKDRQRVLASVTLDRSVSELAVQDSRFWVVRPRVGTAGVSGLNTLLSGAYIAADAGESDERRTHFVALESEPVPLRGEPGRSFVLSADDLGSLEVGSPVYYRRARVGRVVGYTLDPLRDRLDVRVFIESPYEPLVTGNSRFWNASGVDVSVDANGVNVNAQSIASVIGGGIAFASPSGSAAATQVADEGQRFVLFDNEQKALAPPDGGPVRLRMLFDRSVRGLVAGAPVDLLGLELGTVRQIALPYDVRSGHFAVEVTVEVFPMRLASFASDAGPEVVPDKRLLKRLVDNGLRAQLRTGNLLTGQLYVALDFVPKASSATIDIDAPLPTLPTVPGTLSDLQQQLADVIERIGKVPFDRIAGQLQDTLAGAEVATKSLTRTLESARGAIEQLSPEASAALGDVRRTLASAQSSLEGLERHVARPGAPLQRHANDALVELRRAAQALRVLSEYLQRHPQALLRGRADDPAPLPFPSTGAPDARATPGEPAAAEEEPVSR